VPPTSPTRLGSPRVELARPWGVLVGACLGAVIGAACTLAIEPRLACGDGFVDEEANEECEPGVPSSYEDACEGTTRPLGTAACDPYSCTIINGPKQCASCRDGIVDEEAGEECDGDELNGQSCPSGKGTLQCNECRLDYSACDKCGDGVVDVAAGEECEPNPRDGITTERPRCVDLPSPHPDLPYASGSPGPCTPSCRWDRVTCSYCGNGQIDTNRLLDTQGNMAPAEICDGSTLNQALLEQTLDTDPCTAMDSDLRSLVACSEDCTLIRYGSCCVNGGRVCPHDDPGDCCYAQETAGFTPEQDPCEQRAFNQVLFVGCKLPETKPRPAPGG
jgi:hypothetical protein